MWQCIKCREKLEDDFEVCWNCGTSREGVEDPDFRKADDVRSEEMDMAADANTRSVVDDMTAIRAASHQREPKPIETDPIRCLRCHRDLKYVGTKSFHEGFQWGGLFGDLGEFFVNQESFDVYVCPRCGRVEFFASGIGQEFRPRRVAE